MKRLLLLFVSIVVVTGCATAGMKPPAAPVKHVFQWELGALPPVGLNEKIDKMRCGGVYLIRTVGDPKSEGLDFLVGVIGLSEKYGDHFYLTQPAQFVTVIDETRRVPTVEYTGHDGPTMPILVHDGTQLAPAIQITLRISRKDYDEAAQCLPPPSK